MLIQSLIQITAILCIGIIEVTALIHGHNGIILSMCLTILGGIAGYNIKSKSAS